MLTGVYAARNIVGKKYDVWAINTEKVYSEDGILKGTNDLDISRTSHEDKADKQGQSIDEIIDVLFARMDPLALGIAVGIVSGLGLFLATAILLLKGGKAVKF